MNHIVVGVDGSPAAAAALRWAAAEALRRDADLVAVHAWVPAAGRAAVREADLAGERSTIRRRTADWVLDALGPVPDDLRVRVDVTVGRPVAVLLGAARRADLLVLGYDDVTALRPRQTARRCRQAARCRVVVVRASDETPDSLLGVPA
ncbi:MAG TPA: universal stress protein [Kribbellaceae bacterium]|nr:universal stress protein [Kribbellaceae bacterium]